MHSRGPTIVTLPNGGNSGIQCCCFFRCCTCLNLNFVKTPHGVLKVAEVIMGFFCQSLALNYGIKYASAIGPSFQSFITTASWCFMTSFLLLFCYVFSEKSISLIRSSLFEIVFNSIAAFGIISSCSYLGYAVNMFLEPVYLITPYYQVYPAMSAAYVVIFICFNKRIQDSASSYETLFPLLHINIMVGTLLGLVYLYDAYKSYRYFIGYR